MQTESKDNVIRAGFAFNYIQGKRLT
uniref:Uncharacterized protein n=1 Tax=Rhizophora mucronata TaxID=61149 RepID=A0A2P2QX36_RHIMU